MWRPPLHVFVPARNAKPASSSIAIVCVVEMPS